MKQRDIGAYIKGALAVAPQNTAAATVNGVAIDRLAYESCVLVGLTGAATGTPTAVSAAFKLQESADGSTGWADVDGAAVTAAAVNTEAEVDVNLAGALPYVRVVATVALTGGSSPTIDIGSALVFGGAKRLPV